MRNANNSAILLGYPAPKPWRSWQWFSGGFLLAFVGLALFVPMNAYDGNGIRKTVLGNYYILELRHLTGEFGTPVWNETAFESNIALHYAISIMAGVLVMGVGWAFKRRSRVAS